MKRLILAKLKALREVVPMLQWEDSTRDFDFHYGICGNVKNGFRYDELEDVNEVLSQIWVKWSKYSGNPTYPISCTDSDFWDSNPWASARIQFGKTRNYWTGAYGELRIELLDFMIKELSDVENIRTDNT